MPLRVNLKISGRVQGVCFRHYCRECALSLGLKGFVRNDPSGDVVIAAEGKREALRSFVLWCRRGPPGASVRECEENYEKPDGKFESFSIEL